MAILVNKEFLTSTHRVPLRVYDGLMDAFYDVRGVLERLQLLERLSLSSTWLNPNEWMETIELCRTPLTKFQLTQFLFHHAFVVIHTDKAW